MATTGLDDLRSVREAGDRRLVDGGVVNNTPISHAVHLGAERIYVLAIEDPAYRPAHYAPRTALYRAICGLRLVIQTRLEADIARYSPEVELTVMPAPNLGQVPPTSFEHAPRLMMDARFAARTVVAREDAGRHSGWRGEDRLGDYAFAGPPPRGGGCRPGVRRSTAAAETRSTRTGSP